MNNNYLIYGVDKYLIDKEIDKIIKKNKIDNNSIIRYSLNEDSIDNILEDANTFNLFSDTKLIIVNDANIFTSSNDILTDKIINYLNNYNDKSYLVFTLLSDKIDNRKKITKVMSDKGNVIDLNKKDVDTNYIISYLKENGYQINMSDARMILNKVGNNLFSINNELDKLMLFKLEDKVIDKNSIDLLINENIDSSLFALVDSITNKDKNKMLKLYHECLLESDPIMIINMLANKYILLYQVKRLISDGYSDDKIAKELEVHPYPVKLARNMCYSYSVKEILDIILKLANLDKDIKLGNVNGEVGLEFLLLSI
ncbi:dNA polymerase III subunit delta [Clostridium sp. CAG:762]|nr:dNA polymerase III subunit delta [Clostridium sp. CAG:762]